MPFAHLSNCFFKSGKISSRFLFWIASFSCSNCSCFEGETFSIILAKKLPIIPWFIFSSSSEENGNDSCISSWVILSKSFSTIFLARLSETKNVCFNHSIVMAFLSCFFIEIMSKVFSWVPTIIFTSTFLKSFSIFSGLFNSCKKTLLLSWFISEIGIIWSVSLSFRKS